jgi:hypothetical protein
MGSRVRIVLALLACLALSSAAQASVILNNALITNTTDVTQTYSVSIGLPLPPDLYGFASAQGTITVTPGQSGVGTADLAFGESFFFVGTAIDGVEMDLGVGTGTSACVAVRGPETCAFPLVTNTFAPTPFTVGFAKLKFTLTAHTTAEFNGVVTIAPAQAPEPSSLLLLATAAGGAWRARRRNR